MDKPDNHDDVYSLEDLLKQLGIPAIAEIAENEFEAACEGEKLDEISILQKKVRRLEKDNILLNEKANEAENHALLAIQQNYLLREQITAAFSEMARREERTIEKNMVPFEGERTKPPLFYFVKPKDFKEYKKEKKVGAFSYAMGVEHTKWNKN